MKRFKKLHEAAYAGNIGFHEMVMFHRKASKSEEAEMDKIIENEDWAAFKQLIKKVLGISLK